MCVCECVGGYGVAAGCILVGNLGRLKGSKGMQVCFWVARVGVRVRGRVRKLHE